MYTSHKNSQIKLNKYLNFDAISGNSIEAPNNPKAYDCKGSGEFSAQSNSLNINPSVSYNLEKYSFSNLVEYNDQKW